MSGEFWKSIQKGISDRLEREKEVERIWEKRMAKEAAEEAAQKERERREKKLKEPQIVNTGALLEKILNQVIENDPTMKKNPNRLVIPSTHADKDGTIEGIDYRLAIGTFDPQEALKYDIWMIRPGDKIYTCTFGVYPDGLYYEGRIKPDTRQFYSEFKAEKPIPLEDFTHNPRPCLLGIRDLAVSSHLTGVTYPKEYSPGVSGVYIEHNFPQWLPLSKKLLTRVSE